MILFWVFYLFSGNSPSDKKNAVNEREREREREDIFLFLQGK